MACNRSGVTSMRNLSAMANRAPQAAAAGDGAPEQPEAVAEPAEEKPKPTKRATKKKTTKKKSS